VTSCWLRHTHTHTHFYGLNNTHTHTHTLKLLWHFVIYTSSVLDTHWCYILLDNNLITAKSDSSSSLDATHTHTHAHAHTRTRTHTHAHSAVDNREPHTLKMKGEWTEVYVFVLFIWKCVCECAGHNSQGWKHRLSLCSHTSWPLVGVCVCCADDGWHRA